MKHILKKSNKFVKKILLILFIIFVLAASYVLFIFRINEYNIWHYVYKFCGIGEFSFCADNYPMSVHILDVGKADSILIKCENKNILIDAGETDIYNVISEYLKKLDINTIDLLILSHQHSDHVGSMSYVVDDFDIKLFMMPELRDDMIPTFKSYERLLNSINKKNIAFKKPVPGDEFNVGNLKINIFAPLAQYEEMNNNSVVFKATYKNRSFMFTGDAEEKSETDMLASNFDLKSDVLKIGHHGSKTSSSQAFLNKVKPVYAVISVGEDRNKLPKKDIVNRLKENNIKIYRTDLDGNVIFATDGNNINIFCEKGDH